jgi:hypothetical protein
MNKIKFIYHDDLAYHMNVRPEPASNFIPEWHKNLLPYTKSYLNPNGNKIIVEDYTSNASAKKCTPMLDGISSGYIVPLWCDVQVKQERQSTGEFVPKITWRIESEIFMLHGPSSREIPPPFGYSKYVFKFGTHFRIETPPGYSVIVNSPFGHQNLPFYAIPAIVDTDKSSIDNNFPCWIIEGFEGIVEKGTPIAQITPFKREDWKSEFYLTEYKNHYFNLAKNCLSTIKNSYVKNAWSQKKYK